MTADRVQQALAEIGRPREIAQRATAGPWWARPDRHGIESVIVVAEDRVYWAWNADAAHIAAWDPTRALAVLDAAEKVLARHRSTIGSWIGQCCVLDGLKWPCPDALAVLDLYAPDGAA